MTSLARTALAIAVACVPLSSIAQNLISNPGNELPLVAGEITGWTELVGSSWTQRSADPLAYEGTKYFFAGAVADATLRQVVDVSSLSGEIDAGAISFAFSGWVRSWPQTPPDSSTIAVALLDAGLNTLSSYTSGAYANPAAWENISFSLHAPSSTRFVRVDLVAHRNAGTNNDGYFDSLSLVAAAVPEPSAAVLLITGAVALVLRRRSPGGPRSA